MGNLRKMQGTGAESDTATKMTLLSTIEFLTGVTRSFRLIGKYRDFEQVDLLFKLGFSTRTSRMQQLSIPPNYNDEGLYKIGKVVAKKHVEVHHRFLNIMKKILCQRWGIMLTLC
jgi:hypothetical protein